MIRSVLHDLRHGGRLLRGSPGFTAVAVAALAIGIGANTAIFSVVNSLLIQPLPYQDAGQLAMIWEHNLPRDQRSNVVAPANFIHWREMNGAFEDLAGVSMTLRVTLTGIGDPEEFPAQIVSASFFPILGVPPAIGRTFTADEDRPQSRLVVISDRLWKRRFNADRSILQRAVTLQGTPYTVVGVMPPGFSFLDRTVDLWVPIGLPADARTPRGRWMKVVGRLKAGTTPRAAQQEMTRVHAELIRMFPDFNTGWTARVVPLREQLTGDVKPALLLLVGAVGFVLLIACANVANLLLARATARQRELAVRAALGAARGRLVRQLLAESVVLAIAGGAAGLLLAWWALHVLRVFVAERVPIQRLEIVGIDGWVLGFTAAAALLSGLFFGLIPALTASGSNLHESLKEGGRSGSGGRGARARSAFVILEVAVALVLLVGAGLLVRSFVRLLAVDPGFDPDRTVTMRVGLPGSRYPHPAQRIQFFQRLFERADALPGVDSAGAISFLPLTGLGSATAFEISGRPKPERGQDLVCDVRVIAHNYVEAMTMPLVKGRLFSANNPGDAQNRILINATMAKQYWPGDDPIGKRITVAWSDPREDEIIGVVGDTRHAELETEPRATIYWPYARFSYPSMTLSVKASAAIEPLVGSLVSIIREQDAELAVADIRTMEEVVASSVAQRRLTMLLLSIFAGAALLLATVGIYGVIAYSVTQRTQEIGIRMALGAQRSDVLRMVVGHAMTLTAAGIAIGAIGALALSRLISGFLFDTRPADPATFAAVAAVLAGVAALASYLPGRRATRVDPVVALRAE
jgi:putative ABC transport system permease protein